MQFAQLEAAAALASRFGRLPARAFGLGDVDAPAPYLTQLRRWARTRTITSDDGQRDYLAQWASSSVATLILRAARDRAMAPERNVAFVEGAIRCATCETVDRKRFGFDADHFGVLYGPSAAAHVWPRICRYFGEEVHGDSDRSAA
jgi:predicted alpha/beta hydrolase